MGYNKIISILFLVLIPFLTKAQNDDWPRFELYQLVQGQDSGIFVITDSDSNLVFTDLLKMRFFPDTALIFNGDTIAVKPDIPTFVEGLGISIEYDPVLNQYTFESLSIEDSIYNGTASLITKGTPLYAAGVQGNYWSVAPADAGNSAKMPVVIIAGENIGAGQEGLGLIKGHIKQVNTTGLADGAEVYVAVGGGYTTTKPKGENAIVQRLGTVIKGNSTNGSGIINLGDPRTTSNLNPDKIFIGGADSIVTTINIKTLISDSLVNYVSKTLLTDSLSNYVSRPELADTASAIRSSITTGVTGTFVNNSVPYSASGGSTLTNSGWYINSGNLIDRVSTPSYKLDVNGSIGATTLTTSGRINADSILVTKGATFNTQQGSFNFRVDGNLETGLILANASTNRVGIGLTGNPNYKLDVNGDVNISSGSSYRINGTAITGSQWTTTGSDIYYNSGRVGIGMTAPTSTLHVTGDIRGTDDLNIDNGTFFVDASENAVGVGTSSPQFPLDVVGSARIDGSTFFVSSGDNRIGLGTGTPNATLDVRGDAIFNEAGGNFDFRVEGDTDANLFFIDASTDRIGIGNNSPDYKLDINGATRVYGGDFEIWTNNLFPAFMVKNSTDNVGIRTFNPSYELEVIGDVKVDSLFYTGLQQLSDKSIKTNIKPIKNQLENITKLNPVLFEFNDKIEVRKGQKGVGLIAQELEEIYPNLVSTSREDLKSVSYIDLIPYLISAIQEQQTQIKELKAEVKQLKKKRKQN